MGGASVAGNLPTKGEKVQVSTGAGSSGTRVEGESQANRCRWIVWPRSFNGRNKINLAGAGIVSLVANGTDGYSVVDRIPFQEFPDRFAPESFDRFEHDA